MGDKSEWVNKLMGKTIGDSSNETVCGDWTILNTVPGELTVYSHSLRRTFRRLTVS
jgi:hypothetical protein